MHIPSTGLPSSANLTTFWAFGNGFTDLSFLKPINRANLQYFDVGNGIITSINVGDMPELIEFYCNGNSSLTYLDISNNFNDQLNWMWAHDTALSCIQVDQKSEADSKNTNNWRKPDLATYEEFCAVTGIDDFELSGLSIYPNPTKSLINIELKIDANYHLTNVFGQEVKGGTLSSGINEMDLSFLTNGLYLLKFESEDGDMVKKIMKTD